MAQNTITAPTDTELLAGALGYEDIDLDRREQPNGSSEYLAELGVNKEELRDYVPTIGTTVGQRAEFLRFTQSKILPEQKILAKQMVVYPIPFTDAEIKAAARQENIGRNRQF